MTKRFRVQVIENAALEEAGLRSLIAQCEDFELVSHVRCKPSCSHRCIKQSPHILVMEAAGDGRNSMDCIRDIRARHPDIAIMYLSLSGDPMICRLAMNAGASGFASKQMPAHLFLDALRQLTLGKRFVEPWVAQQMIEGNNGETESPPFLSLSKREYAIVQLMLSGKSNADIADQLHISTSTLGNHRAHIMKKLGTTNMVKFVRLAIRHGMMD